MCELKAYKTEKYAHDASLVLGTNDLPIPSKKFVAVRMASEKLSKPGLSSRSKGNKVSNSEGLQWVTRLAIHRDKEITNSQREPLLTGRLVDEANE